MRRLIKVVLGATACLVLSNVAVLSWAEQEQDAERAALAQALSQVTVSLEQGLSASEREGKPISAKFEMDEGKLQLSVYTMKDNKFFEVIVDHHTGNTVKVEPIAGGDDLAAAQAQSEAMAKAKIPLAEAISKALKDNSGFRAVSVVPGLKDGNATAEITLVHGDQWKTLSEKLD